MKVLNAIEKVLLEAQRPLHYREITRCLLVKGLWKSSGKTPWHSIKSRLIEDISRYEDASRFKRVDRGVYALTEWNKPVRKAKRASTVSAAPDSDIDAARDWVKRAIQSGWAIEDRRHVCGWFGFSSFCRSVRDGLRNIIQQETTDPEALILARTPDDHVVLLARGAVVVNEQG